MAIKGTTRALNDDMTVEEFKEWLKLFDVDGDGRISKAELRKAFRSVRGRFSSWKSGRGLRQADANGDGFINDDEIENLVDFAQNNMGLKIATY